VTVSCTRRLLKQLVRLLPEVNIRSFDHDVVGPENAKTHIVIKDPAAIFQLLRAPRGLGLARAWVTGQIEIFGDIAPLIKSERKLVNSRLAVEVVGSALRLLPQVGLKVIRATGPTDTEYSRFRPGTHSIASDLREIDFHYSLPPDYYSRILGPSMTYSCAVFPDNKSTLEQAQNNKHKIIANKLRLSPESSVLDIGCGWGGFLEYVNREIGCPTVGITASQGQYNYLNNQKDRIGGLILHGDYRQHLPTANVSHAVSIGMYEHVGAKNSLEFFSCVNSTLPSHGLFLNQAIVRSRGNAQFRKNGFIQRYIFPNAHVLSLSRQLLDIEKAGFSVISIETFGSHYADTLTMWNANLRKNWDDCVKLVGEATARAWIMYLEGSRFRFEAGIVDLAQVLVQKQK